MTTDDLYNELKRLSDLAKTDDNPQQVRAIAAVLLICMSALKCGRAFLLMNYVCDFAEGIVKTAEARRN